MEYYDVALNRTMSDTVIEPGSIAGQKVVLHEEVKMLMAKCVLMSLAAVKVGDVKAYDDIVSGRKLILLKATTFDFTQRSISEFTESDFSIVEMNDESIDIIENKLATNAEELGVAKVFRTVYEKMKKSRRERKRGEFSVFFMYLGPGQDERTVKVVSDGILIDNSTGEFDKSVNSLIETLGDNFAELY